MADDVKLKITADAADATQKVGQFGKAVEQVGDKAEKSGKKTAAGGVDLEQVGQKSERAASSLMQLSGAVAQIGKGGGDLQSVSILAKEATGSLGDLGDVLVKMGGQKAALGGVLQSLSGLAGPIGVAVAAGTALVAIWKAFNTEVEKTPAFLDGAAKRAFDLREQLAGIKQEILKATEQKGTARDTEFAQKGVEAASQGPGGISRLIDALTGLSIREQGKGVGPNELASVLSEANRERTRRDMAELLRDAQEGSARAQVILTSKIQAALAQERGEGQAADPKIIEALERFVQPRKDQAEKDRKATKKKQADDEQKIKDDEQKRIESKATEAAPIIAAAEKAGLDVAAVMSEIAESLKQEGLDSDGVTKTLAEIRKELDRNKRGLKGLADSIEQQASDAKAAQQREEAERKQKEADAKAKELAAQQEVAQQLQAIVQILQQVHGDEAEARTRIIDGLVKAGKPLAEAKAFADKAIPTAQQAIGQKAGQEQTAKGLGLAAQGKSLQDLIKEEREKFREGRGDVHTDQDAIERGRQRFRDQREAAKQDVRDRMADREKQFKEKAGREPNAGERRQMARDEFAANRAAQRERGPVGGPPPGQPDKPKGVTGPTQPVQPEKPKRVGDFVREERERRGRGEDAAAESDSEAIARGRDRFKAQAQPAPGSRRPKPPQAAAGAQRGSQGGRQGDAAAAGFDPQGLTQEMGELNQNFPAMIEEFIAIAAQMGMTIQNMNAVNRGARQAAQSIRRSLPGPGAFR